MEKKMSKAKALKAYAKLMKAQEKFIKAINEFENTYQPNAVGMGEWIEYNEDVMSDLEQDIEESFEENE